MATQLPTANIPTNTSVPALISQLNSLLPALAQALSEKLTAHRVAVSGYAATGATTTKLRLLSGAPQGSTPWAVILVRCRPSRDPGADLSVTTRINFTLDQGTLSIYEPAGLTADTQYDLDFLVLE